MEGNGLAFGVGKELVVVIRGVRGCRREGGLLPRIAPLQRICFLPFFGTAHSLLFYFVGSGSLARTEVRERRSRSPVRSLLATFEISALSLQAHEQEGKHTWEILGVHRAVYSSRGIFEGIMLPLTAA